MQLSEFTFRLLLVFIPGIISFIIIDNLTIHKETKLQHWVIYSLLLGFLSYLPWAIVISIVNELYNTQISIYFLNYLGDAKAAISFKEIFIASCMAIIMGVVMTKLINKRIFFLIANFFGISEKFPEIDAWENLINTYKPRWITVRNFENGLVYSGELISSSDANDRDGIVLENVEVFDDTGDKLYDMKVIYIPQKMEKLLIEVFGEE